MDNVFRCFIGKVHCQQQFKSCFFAAGSFVKKENSGSICFLSDINYGGLVDIKTVDPSAGENKTTLSLCLLFANSWKGGMMLKNGSYSMCGNLHNSKVFQIFFLSKHI